MNRLVFALLLFSSLAHASIVYTVDTERSGFSSVVLSLESEHSANVSLPEDAANFRIVGGSYKISNNTASVFSGPSAITTFSFSSSALTTKTPSGWKLVFTPPPGSKIAVFMPPFATIENSVPQPARVSSQDSRTFIEFPYSEIITVEYRLEESPPLTSSSDMDFYIIAAAIVLAMGIIIASVILMRKAPSKATVPEEKTPTLDITAGKKEMMETFNENDLKIVNHLLKEGGRSKRNELERKTGISKSSLAMAINRLEKRKIIEIDRTSTTHFVKLSEYFLKL